MSRRLIESGATRADLFNLTAMLNQLVFFIAIGVAMLSNALGWSVTGSALTVANYCFLIACGYAAIWAFVFHVLGIEIETPSSLWHALLNRRA